MDSINVNMENLSEDERKQLLLLINKANKPKSFCLESMDEGDVFYYINVCEEVIEWCFTDSKWQRGSFLTGNAFPTREAAEFEVERRKVIRELKEFIAENDTKELDWEDANQPKFSLYINIPREELDYEPNYSNCGKQKGVFASSGGILMEAVKEIGEERIKKYLFA